MLMPLDEVVQKVDAEERGRVELNIVHTSCRDCVFAQYAQTASMRGGGGPACDTQVGCSLGRLDKYRAQGSEIVEAFDESGTEFFVVNGRQCPAMRDRNSEWAKKVHPENRADAVRQELVARVDFVVLLDHEDPVCNNKNIFPKLLEKTVESARNQYLKPSSVTLVNNQDAYKPGELVALMGKFAGDLNWQMVDVKERTLEGKRVDAFRAFDVAVGKLKGSFYTQSRPGCTFPPRFTLDLDKAVVDEMGRFVVLEAQDEFNTSPYAFAVSTAFHRAPMINGNKAVPATSLDENGEDEKTLLVGVYDKAKFLAEKKGLPHLVVKAEEVCPTLK